ncbi:DNA-binding protein [Desulfosarcina alkanivorans]|jgi:excisionase family DNA binding protein|uniref:DNA-binding protein n=1 Tax=Desulfosarcina alkanivorans TaxID=571177 RepID=A0A5K7YR27_9BACT|nr:helix-turn-helix transcriptional regulator [Desulfosarcina alkanivorans]BBO70743.1 DNA-binding protein [Desulfosarcina alkanivorans]
MVKISVAENAVDEGDDMTQMLSTKEVAKFLGINEKMVYTLISEKGLPASKVTGKWIFPRHLVEQWVESNTVNYPQNHKVLPPYEGLLVIAGSNDILLEKTLSLFNLRHSGHLAVFGNLGSVGGISALRRNLCHVATSHLLQENGDEYNFDFLQRQFDRMPVVVNFCRRDQGIILPKGNPNNVRAVKDLAKEGVRIVNRSLATGTRLLFDRELKQAGIAGERIIGYDREVGRHMDVGLEILSGRADAGPGIRPVASLLGLDFLPLRQERYDLLVTRERFFDQGIQYFLSLVHEKAFIQSAEKLEGYDVSTSGKMIFPHELEAEAERNPS